jgi:hypothetical protein
MVKAEDLKQLKFLKKQSKNKNPLIKNSLKKIYLQSIQQHKAKIDRSASKEIFTLFTPRLIHTIHSFKLILCNKEMQVLQS